MMKRTLAPAVVILLALLSAGCPALWLTDKPVTATKPDELFRLGEELFQQGEFTRAIEVFERLKSGHSDFDRLPLVYLRLADAFFYERAYEKAIARYFQFLELYPAHREVPRAKYYIGLGYFNQIKNIDLDSTAINQAAKALKNVADDPNGGEWSAKAKEKYTECLKKMAEKELYKASQSEKMGNYQAAKVAAQRVLDKYPNLGFDAEAKGLVERLKNK